MKTRLPDLAVIAALAIAVPAPLLAQNGPPPAGYAQGGGQGRYARGGGQGVSVQQLMQKMRAKLGRLDTNHDNRISQAEFAARKQRKGGGGGKDPARKFNRIDIDHDGFISVRELDAYVQKRVSHRDRNHDGVISPDEKGGKGGKGGGKHGGQGRDRGGDDDDQY